MTDANHKTRRLAIGCGALAVLVVVALAWLPSFFEDKVADAIRSELDSRLDADVDFRDIDLSLLTTFPSLTAEVRDLRLVGKGEFEGQPLLSATSVGAGVDLWALVVRDELVIEAVRIDSPDVNVIVREDGGANYDIVMESEPSGETAEPLQLRVTDYRVRDGTLRYEAPDASIRVAGLNHEGSASIEGSTQKLNSKTRVEALTLVLGSSAVLRDARAAIALDATVMSDAAKVVLDTLRLELGALSVEGSGEVAWQAEATEIDVDVASGDGQSIAALLSLVPGAYAGNLDDVDASGRFSLAGRVKGQLGPDKEDIPAFSLRLEVRDGTVQFPDLPLPLKNLDVDAAATHPGGGIDALALDVEQFQIAAGSSRLAGSLHVRRPVSEPDVELAVDGRVDAEDLKRAYPLSNVEALSGIVTTNVDLAARGDDIERLEGDLRVDDLVYQTTDAPPTQVSGTRIVFTPKATAIRALNATFGSSDVQLTGTLSPLTRFFGDDDVGGVLKLRSDKIVVDEFISDGSGTKETGETTRFLLPDRIDAALTVDVGRVEYDEMLLESLRGAARLTGRTLTLHDVRTEALGGTMKISGTIATPLGKPATFDLRYAIERASFATAFESLSTMQAFAPIARFLDGRFSANIAASGQLQEDGAPKLRTIDADGRVAALQGKVGSDFPPLVALTRAVPAIPRPLNLGRVQTRFSIEDGAVKVRPFDIRTGGLVLNVRGSHGLDRAMDYRIGTKLPMSKLTGELERQVRKLGIDPSKADAIDVAVRVTGTVSEPSATLDVDADALRSAVADTITQELQARRQQALELLTTQNERALAEAQARADRVRDEAKKAADRIRREGNARADQLVEEARGNALAEIAAKEAALRLRRESEKRASQLEQEADQRADKLLADAEQRAAALLEQMDDKSEDAVNGAQETIR